MLGTPARGLAQQLDGALRGPDGRPREPELDLLRSPRARDPVVLALEVPGHSGLERLLVRTRRPAKLASGLGRSIRPPLARRADLEGRERPAAAGGPEH